MTSLDDARTGTLPAFALRSEVGHRLRMLRERPQVSYLVVLALTGLLVIVGLVFVLSASSVHSIEETGSSTVYLSKQLMWAGGGLFAMLVVARLPMRALRLISIPALIVSFVLLLAVPVVGVTVGGARRWIDIGPMQLQPSEIAKIALILWCADVLIRKEQILGDVKHLLIPVLPVTGVICALIVKQPDLGTAMVCGLVMMSILWVVGTPGRIYAYLVASVVSLVALLAVIEPYRFERLSSFLHPFKDPNDTGFQAVQGLYALSSGGWFGVGLGGSREKWSGLLPNAHTDFIFAVIGEETGLVGALLVLSLFAALAMVGVRIARRSVDPYARLVAAGVTAWLVGQAVINVATVVGIAPITGIPLPFISYGGTSLVLTMAAAGMLAACARTEPGAREALARRSWRRRRRPMESNVVTMPTSRRSRSARPATARPPRR